jgi:hypothetical protein
MVDDRDSHQCIGEGLGQTAEGQRGSREDSLSGEMGKVLSDSFQLQMHDREFPPDSKKRIPASFLSSSLSW